jgi:outer membrane protein OmpU
MKTKENIMNMKKIGLSALAGSLAMVSAHAVDVAVTGKTEITFLSEERTGDTVGASNGNPWGMGNELAFSGSGDVNGMTAAYMATLGDGGSTSTFASSKLTLDMGDLGLIGFDQGVGSFGASTIDDMMPYAYEEANYGTGGTNGLRAAGTAQNVLGYIGTFGGMKLNVEIDPGSDGTGAATGDGSTSGAGTTNSGYNFAVTGAIADGMNAGIGYGDEDNGTAANGTSEKYATAYVTYAVGAATVGYQRSEGTGGLAGVAGNSTEMYGISYSVNENLALSFNIIDNTFNKASLADVEEETQGMGVSYTMGSAAVRVVNNTTDNLAGDAGAEKTITEVSLLLAF